MLIYRCIPNTQHLEQLHNTSFFSLIYNCPLTIISDCLKMEQINPERLAREMCYKDHGVK